MEPPFSNDPDVLKDGMVGLFRAIPAADPARYVRGQYEGYRSIEGVADDSQTETYAALELHIDNWRWSGVPFFIRTGKCLPVTQTEVRLIFRQAPKMGFGFPKLPEPDQLVVKLDPDTGILLLINAQRGDLRVPEQISLGMEFAEQGGEGPTPYENLLSAALVGNSQRFTRQDGVQECWRVMAPLIENPPPVVGYAKGSYGPAEADALLAGHGRWRGPWVVS
jgi:glucose-6-phosphate 1-dehydrogenase